MTLAREVLGLAINVITSYSIHYTKLYEFVLRRRGSGCILPYMKTEEFSFIADDGKSIHVYHWAPDGEAKACVLVAHGMAEHAARYARFAAPMRNNFV